MNVCPHPSPLIIGPVDDDENDGPSFTLKNGRVSDKMLVIIVPIGLSPSSSVLHSSEWRHAIYVCII